MHIGPAGFPPRFVMHTGPGFPPRFVMHTGRIVENGPPRRASPPDSPSNLRAAPAAGRYTDGR
jgi:hypothetical protein